MLAVDLDGVCAKYSEAFREIIKRETDRTDADLPLSRAWNFEDWGLDNDEFERLHDLAVREYHMYRDLDVYESCADVLWRLSDAGAWIRIVTHRLYTKWGHDTAVMDTAQWLDNSKIPYRDLCFLGAKSDVDADTYIEDAPHNLERLRSCGRHVIVFHQPYNENFAEPRAHNWLEVEQQVMELLAAHQGLVEPTLPGVSAAGTRLHTHKYRLT